MKIMLGADLVPTENTEKYFIAKDLDTLFGKVKNLPKTVDRCIVNLEFALTNLNAATKKFGPNLKADPLCADAIKEFGVTDVLLSNNHVFDFAVEGFVDTMKNLDRVGIPYTGVGENDTLSRKPYIIEKDGQKVGIINVCEHEYSYALPNRMGTNPFNPFVTMQDVRALRKEVDHLIVCYHGGKEHCRYPSPRLRDLCRELVNNGADLVVTQHSHCIGCYEEFNGGQIVYGQGNFHFCYDNKTDLWNTSLILMLDITDKINVEFIPIVSSGTGIDLAEGDKKEEILTAFYKRNEELKNGKWLDGWKAFCEEQKGSYFYMATRHPEGSEMRRQMLAHHLDCEAHTDVWREILQTWHTTEKY